MIVARDRIRGLDLQISSRFGGRFYRVSLIIYENVRLWRNGKFGSNGNGHYHRDNWIFGWNAFGPREKPFQLITRNGIGICVPLLSTKIFLIFNFVAVIAALPLHARIIRPYIKMDIDQVSEPR